MSATRDALLAKLKDLSPEQRDALLKKIQQQKATESDPTRALEAIARTSDGYPLSFAQQRLWFLEKLYPNSAAYHIAVAIELNGKLDTQTLEQSFIKLIERHESLRTQFIERDNSVLQQVLDTFDWCLDIAVPDENALLAQAFNSPLAQDAARPFDLSNAPLLRAKLYCISATQHVLSLVMHHIISDAWSSQILLAEVSALYNAQIEGKSIELPSLTVQYIDYSEWQKQTLANKAFDKQQSYWLEQLKPVENLQIGSDKNRPAVLSQNGAVEVLSLTQSQIQTLQTLCQQHKTSLYVGLLAAFQFVLSRYSQQTNFAIGTPIAGRNHEKTQNIIGFFVNTQALPCQIESGDSFVQLLEKVRQQNFAAQDQQDIPFEQIIDQLNLARDGSYSPVFQAFFSYQPGKLSDAVQLNGLSTRFIDIATDTAKFELSLVIRDDENGLHCLFEYNRDIYTPLFIQQLAQHFSQAIEQLSQAPEQTLNRIALLSPQEQNELLKPQNHQNYPDVHLADLFEQQALIAPDKIAVKQGERSLTFAELNQQANQLALHLIEQGVKAGDFVGLCFAPCLELPTALLAAIKIGACYVPIDPSYPSARVQHMLSHLSVATVITAQRFAQSVADLPNTNTADALTLIDLDQLDLSSNHSLPTQLRDSEQLLYVIFTSGSTGTPKAAAVRHHNASNLLHWYSDNYQLNSNDKFLVFSAIGFDLTQKNLLTPLCFGAQLHFSAVEHYDPETLLNTIEQDQITWTNCAPSAFYPLASSVNFSKLNSLKKLFFGGEPIRLDNLQPWLDSASCQASITNMYGPTECTDIATSFSFDKTFNRSLIPIGKPAANVGCYVLDAQLNLLPKSVIGELYIGGAGVGAGYLHNDALNQESFISNPFGAGKLYKTGDLVRYNEQDELVFISRADQQLKIRGFRIELGEIEAQLRLVDGVTDCVVAVQEINQTAQLCAFIISDADLLSREAYRKALQQSLPDYMIPVVFQEIAHIPLSPNGKVDRKQLPQLDASDIAGQRDYIAPRNEIEESLASILQSVLNLPKVGIHDNFFELGGNSLSATQVASRIQQTFQLDLPLRTLFEMPTIEALAGVIAAIHQPLNDDAADDDDFEEGFL